MFILMQFAYAMRNYCRFSDLLKASIEEKRIVICKFRVFSNYYRILSNIPFIALLVYGWVRTLYTIPESEHESCEQKSKHYKIII